MKTTSSIAITAVLCFTIAGITLAQESSTNFPSESNSFLKDPFSTVKHQIGKVNPVIRQIKEGFTGLHTDKNMLYALFLSGLIANTSLDQRLQFSYHENIRTSQSNHFSYVVKHFGEGRITFSTYVATYLLGKATGSETITKWSKNSTLAALISVPGLLSLQAVLGASRPYHGFGSKWWAGQDGSNGASGHTWVGAIPFITAAKMTNNSWLKSSLYIASTFSGISRINDDAHFTSQVLLGYSLAFCSVSNIVDSAFLKDKVSMSFGQQGVGFKVDF